MKFSAESVDRCWGYGPGITARLIGGGLPGSLTVSAPLSPFALAALPPPASGSARPALAAPSSSATAAPVGCLTQESCRALRPWPSTSPSRTMAKADGGRSGHADLHRGAGQRSGAEGGAADVVGGRRTGQ